MSAQRMPRVATVARLQFELLLRMKYVLGLSGIFTVFLLFFYGMTERRDSPPWITFPSIAFSTIGFVCVGGIAAVVAWFNEGPSNRRYHWSMPITREVHDIMRIAAGAVWLVVLIAMYCVIAWFAEPAPQREHWLSRAPWFWFGMFAVPLLSYALATIPSLLVGRPLVWLLGGLLLAISLSSQLVKKYVPALGDVGSALFGYETPPSLAVAFSGGSQTAPWHYGRERYRVYQATADSVFARMISFDESVHGGPQIIGRRAQPSNPDARMDADGIKRLRSNFDKGMHRQIDFAPPFSVKQWLTSLALWYGVALLGIALALTRRPNV